MEASERWLEPPVSLRKRLRVHERVVPLVDKSKPRAPAVVARRAQAPRDAGTSALCPENRSIRGFCRRLSAEAARSLAHRRLGLRRRQPALRAPAQMAEPPAPAPPAIQTPATLPAVTPPPTEPLPPALCARRARAVTPLPPWPSPRAARQRAICATTCSHRLLISEMLQSMM